MWVRAEFPSCLYRSGVTQVQQEVCQGTWGRPRWHSCPHSFVYTPQLHCTAARFSYSWEFSQQLSDKSYVNWRWHLALPSSSAPAVPCSGPSTSRFRLMLPDCRQPVCAGWPRRLRWDGFQIFLAVKLNWRLCFSWFVCACQGGFSVVVLTLPSVKGLWEKWNAVFRGSLSLPHHLLVGSPHRELWVQLSNSWG